jgi:hypothetical protein
MGNAPSWAYTGDRANKALDAELEKQKKRREAGGKVPRIWMKADKNKILTFVDGMTHPKGYDLPFAFMEHQIKINDDWKNWFTCLGRGCPLCEGNNKPYLARAYTVIDHSEWESKADKKTHKDEIRLFVCKTKVGKILQKAADKKKGLRGWRVDVSRATDESPNTGDTFDWEEKTELPLDVLPLDYAELFAPKTKEEIVKILSGVMEPVGYDEDDATPVNTEVEGEVEDNVKF